MSNRTVRTEYRVENDYQILKVCRDRAEASSYLTTVRRGGFLPLHETASLRIATVTANR